MTFNLINTNILITGGSGQIGSHLVEALLDEKSNITVLGRNPLNLKEILPLYSNQEINFVKCDLADEENILSIGDSLSHIQYLIHFASEMAPSFDNIRDEANYITELNLKGVIRLLKYLKNLKGICFASSMAVYGKPAYIPVDEKCPHTPISFYGSAKSGSEKFFKLFSKSRSIPLTILRFASIYGPRNRTGRSIPFFIKSALENKTIYLIGEGKGYRDFIYITDSIKATISAIKLNEDSDYNIGSGIPCSMFDLASIIVKLTNSHSEISFVNKPNNFNFLFDISKSKQELSFYPGTTLKEGLAKEIEWHKLNNRNIIQSNI